MHDLEMPNDLARRCTKCNNGICEQIVARTFTTVEIWRRTSSRNKNKIPGGIGRDGGPCVRCTGDAACREWIPCPLLGAIARVEAANSSTLHVHAPIVADG